ncbi:MAG TPA: CpXC domain-containing protein [Tepidisphaeraceae bacterium]|nr:CpXC domain-containing protein [Tepidisphaeraceae bacterium]
MKIKLPCPGCGAPAEFVSWTSLNATLDPHEKTRLLDRSLTQFKCSACGHEAQVIYPLLYHDMDNGIMIWLLPPSAAEAKEPEALPADVARQLGERYRYRAVSHLNELIEKIQIFDAGLDDRVVELAKLVAAAKLPPEKIGASEVFFGSMAGEGASATMHFAVLLPPPGVNFGFSLLRDPVCSALTADFAEALKEQPADPWPRVDDAFARGIVKKKGDE